MAKYTISQPILSNGEIIGYTISDGTKLKKLKLDAIYKIIAKGGTNCELVEHEGTKLIHFIDSEPGEILEDIQSEYTLVSRYTQNGKIVGYLCKENSTGETKRLKPHSVCELASFNRITNAEIKIVNNNLCLLGKGDSLSKLVEINL